TYGDCKKEMDMVNKAFIEVMIEGDANGRGFQYPIPTYSITRDFDWSETENNKLLFEMTAKYGTPYFSNYINSDMEPSDVRSMCCRLRLDLRELRKKSGGFFGSGESTGSVGVVTINMPRIAYLAKDEKAFYAELDRMMDIAARSLKTKRTVITKLLEAGLYPYTKRYLGTFNNHFSTIGLIGMNEVGLNANWLRKDLTHPETQRFTREVLNHMRNRLSDYQEKYGDLYNLEATPAESTTYRFAKHDKSKYPDIITANMNGTPYYTNSSHLPVGYTEDIFSALDIQDDLQTLYTSGTVFHAFLGEKLPDWKAAANLVRKIAENYKLPYYTISPTYSVCKDHGYITGEHFTCPICGQKTEVYSRITGYYRPVQNWNDGKAQEFKDRKVYNIGRSHLTHQGPNPAPDDTIAEAAKEAVQETPCCAPTEAKTVPEGNPRFLLFKTPTCPNCKVATMLLEKAGIPFVALNANEEKELVEKYGVKQAPTLVLIKDDGIERYRGVSDIKGWLMHK
ncbi:MAG: ribonucleoside triphosphate reductase, partial [Clostridia bacterium]|nr:ribonucleoside triphosphate reductase [Clostridia bacterium]